LDLGGAITASQSLVEDRVLLGTEDGRLFCLGSSS